MTAKPVSQSRVEMAQIMQPNDANFLGKVFGGRVLEMIDLCAYAASAKHSGRICVTASFDRVDFHEPINLGELVTLIGYVSYVGRTSLEVTIEVYAQNLMTSDRRHTNTARVTMVALDANGKPVAVPGLIAENREEKLRFLEGKLRRESRALNSEAFRSRMSKFEQASDAEIEALLKTDRLIPG
jgi:acyl-CoA hydrolase